jgi:hypothetical protein
VALNRVLDPSLAPSQILGTMKGIGTILVINPNGVVFGGGAQVNARSLVVSSLPINKNLANPVPAPDVSHALLDNPDLQFMFSSLKEGTGDFDPEAGDYADSMLGSRGYCGDITIQAGAKLTSTAAGGLIALFAPRVYQEGSILAPDSQVILAAGQQVGLVAHATEDASLRGLDVFVGKVTDPDAPVLDGGENAIDYGLVANRGLVEAARGSIVLAGKTIEQNGALLSSTSVKYNGRVDLLADYLSQVVTPTTGPIFFNPTETGVVTLGAGSVTQILPEWENTETVDAAGAQKFLPSQINIEGEAVHFAAKSDDPASGAIVLAPGGKVAVRAGKWFEDSAKYSLLATAGQVYLDSGVSIDVAGSLDVTASVGKFFIPVELRSAELADSPLQRDGALYQKTVCVDMRQYGTDSASGLDWVGSPIANLFGYLGTIQNNVAELTAPGGSVTVCAGESFVMQSGSSINVSGGSISYADATVNPSRLLSDGIEYDISKATPGLVYSGVVDPSGHSRVETGYKQGANAGTLAISAPAMALDGGFYGAATTGPWQRMSVAVAADKILKTAHTVALSSPTDANLALDSAAERLVRQAWRLPTAGALSLVFHGKDANDPDALKTAASYYSPTPPEFTFKTPGKLTPAAVFAPGDYDLSAERRAACHLSSDVLSAGGFGQLGVDNSDGDIVLPAGASLNGRPGGSISLTGANVDIQGGIALPGGSVALQANNLTWYASDDESFLISKYDPGRGHIRLGAGAAIRTEGLMVDDRLSSSTAYASPLITSGGSITIKALSVDLETGSLMDVSGGVSIGANGKVTYGDGGNLAVEAGMDPVRSFLIRDSLGNRLGHLDWNGTVKGYSGAKGGSLKIMAPAVAVVPTIDGGKTIRTIYETDGYTLMELTPDFFYEGGFNSFVIQGVGRNDLDAVRIETGVNLAPVVRSVQLDPSGAAQLAPCQLSVGLRMPVSLEFSAPDVSASFLDSNYYNNRSEMEVVMEPGTMIATGPAGQSSDGKPVVGTVTLRGDVVSVQGSIQAPGGTIAIKGSSSKLLFLNRPTVHLGPGCTLAAEGTVLLIPNAYGLRTGSVLPGGAISVTGNVYAEEDSRLLVSGTSGTLDLALGAGTVHPSAGPPSLNVFSYYTPTTVDSDGGSITVGGGHLLVMNAKMEGRPGGPSAQGGSLKVSCNSEELQNPPPGDVQIYLTAAPSVTPGAFPGLGKEWRDTNNKAFPAYFPAEYFNESGLGALTLLGNVQYLGDVTLTASRSLTIGKGDDKEIKGGVLYGASSTPSSLTLNAPYVAIGQALLSPEQSLKQETGAEENSSIFDGPFAPSWGSGVLKVGLSGNEGGSVVSDADNRVRLIDIGNLSLQNIKEATFCTVPGGEIRGSGTLDAAGTLNFAAGQISPLSATVFNVAAYDGGGNKGTINIYRSGSSLPPLPLSAGGELNLFADTIKDEGVLRAPIGTIRLGAGDAPPRDPWRVDRYAAPDSILFPVTDSLTLAAGSVTSVSAVDPATGEPLTLPYGTLVNGAQWLDPAGTDITGGLLPAKTVKLDAAIVTVATGATIDLCGGGDLQAYEFVPGLKGSRSILNYTADSSTGYAGTKSYAVIPGFTGWSGDLEFSGSSSAPAVGDMVHLAAGGGIPEGDYVLLPASYALLSGAFLVTPKYGTPLGTSVEFPDGTSVVAGYRFNMLNAGRTGQTVIGQFEVASAEVLGKRAQYDVQAANKWLKEAAETREIAVPRLPKDGGQLVVAATGSLDFRGSFQPTFGASGLSSLVDLAKPGNCDFSVDTLKSLNAGSLLVGGYRTAGSRGMEVTVLADALTLSKGASATLSGADVILAAKGGITIGDDVQILAESSDKQADTLILDGNGSLVRICGSAEAAAIRENVVPSDALLLTVGRNVVLGGASASVILDSTGNAGFDNTAKFNGSNVAVSGGRISLQLEQPDPGEDPGISGLAFSSGSLADLQANAKTLSLASYSSIDFYGDGAIGSAGNPLGNLTLRAGVALPDMVKYTKDCTITKIDGTNFVLPANTPTRIETGSKLKATGGAGDLVFDSGNSGPVTFRYSGSDRQLSKVGDKQSLSKNQTIDFVAGTPVGDIGEFSIRGFSRNGVANQAGAVTIYADKITLGNSIQGAPADELDSAGSGSLTLRAQTIHLGDKAMSSKPAYLAVTQFGALNLTASQGIVFEGKGDPAVAPNTLAGAGSITIAAPVVTGATGANQTIQAKGTLVLDAGTGTPVTVDGLGARLTLEGTKVDNQIAIVLPSGQVTLHATGAAADKDVTIGGRIEVGGKKINFFDVAQYTDGGQVSLISDHGNIGVDGEITATAADGGGAGGKLTIQAIEGTFACAGALNGQAGGDSDSSGVFSMDVGSVPSTDTAEASSMDTVNASLNAGNFNQSRSFRIRAGNVTLDGPAIARNFTVSADLGSITVTDTIDASGPTGGHIALYANNGVVLQNGASLDVTGDYLDNAGKGGTVNLETYQPGSGIAIQSDSKIDLSVTHQVRIGDSQKPNPPTIDSRGTLYLRARRTASNNDVPVAAAASTIVNPGSIIVEGFRAYTDTSVDNKIATVTGEATDFMTSGNISAIEGHIAGVDSSLIHVRPGIEIQSGGDLTLAADWNLSALRYFGEPGALTLRAANNLVFQGSLSDGFAQALPGDPTDLYKLTPMTGDSWSYRLIAGADTSAADYRQVKPVSQLTPDTPSKPIGGSLLLGKNISDPSVSGFDKGLSDVSGFTYQTIRTGIGDIDISAGGDVLLLNQFAAIYTAGARIADPNDIDGDGIADFDRPVTQQWQPTTTFSTIKGYEAWLQNPDGSYALYPAHYTQDGGNVFVSAQNDIARKTLKNGYYVYDSELQLPVNWLYRRGQVGADGLFALGRGTGDYDLDPATPNVPRDAMSTTWWVSFMNFFEGVGALGGGNVSLIAGRDIYNVDGLIPTNARMPGYNTDGTRAAPDAAKLVQLGGGDLLVQAGHDINGGVYYVEKGGGTLVGGNQIATNPRRAVSVNAMVSKNKDDPIDTCLPTLLFGGETRFDVSAWGDLTILPTVNVFMLPEGISNQEWYKTAFSTFSPDAETILASLTGSATIRQVGSSGLLGDYLTKVLLSYGSSVAKNQPWLRLNELSLNSSLGAAIEITAPSLQTTAFAGDLRLLTSEKGLNLWPSPSGSLALYAQGDIRGLNPVTTGSAKETWYAGSILVSDANPANLYRPSKPYSVAVDPWHVDEDSIYDADSYYNTPLDWGISPLCTIFDDSGALNQTLEKKQWLHGSSGLLHANDPTGPVRLYARTGDISGFSLISPKAIAVIAGQDISDAAFYAQNLSPADVSLVAAGRDIRLFDLNSAFRQEMKNRIASGAITVSIKGDAKENAGLAGDIQIGGPGALEVLAGRNLDFGENRDRKSDATAGLALGIVSVGNTRNPLLPRNAGAQIIAGSGLGSLAADEAASLIAAFRDSGAGGSNSLTVFRDAFLNPLTAGAYSDRYLPILGAAMKAMKPALTDIPADQVWTYYQNLAAGQTTAQTRFSEDEQAQLALGVYFVALRDAGTGGTKYTDSSSAMLALKNIFTGPAPAYRSAYAAELADAIREMKPELAGLVDDQAWLYYQNLGPNQSATFSIEEQVELALTLFPFVLPEAGGGFGKADGYAAIEKLFPGSRTEAMTVGGAWQGDISLAYREIATKQGGNITLFAPGGGLTVGLASAAGSGASDQSKRGILTERGGNISVFAEGDVDVGTSRIFTLYGGNQIIWSSLGDIAAGNSAKTVTAAPTTSVSVDPPSMVVDVDPAGVATGGGIGSVESLPGTPPGDITLLAPLGIIDAGDAGIRSSGRLTIVATAVLNAANIQAVSSSGVPTASPSAPDAAPVSVANAVTKPNTGGDAAQTREPPPDIITVEVVGFGSDASNEMEEELRRKKKKLTAPSAEKTAQTEVRPPLARR